MITKRKAILLTITAVIIVTAAYNHNVFRTKPSRELGWIQEHLRTEPNRRIRLIDDKAAYFTTPLKRLGFRGWQDMWHSADLTGSVIQVAHSTDDFFTLDVRIDRLILDTNGPIWTSEKGIRFIRVEYHTPTRIREKSSDYLRLRDILLGSQGKVVHVTGRLMWDFDSPGWLEIHPLDADAPPELSTLHSMLDLRLFTFNIWDLPLALPGSDRRRRMTLIPTALMKLDADIIALQEVFEPSVRRQLVDALSSRYFSPAEMLTQRLVFGLIPADTTGGLMLFSKYPITESAFYKHSLPPHSKFSERIGRKGILHCTLHTPLGELDIFTVHAYAGRNTKDVNVRLAQLNVLLSRVRNARGQLPTIVMGDLNSVSPTPSYESAPEYVMMKNAGMQDVLVNATLHPSASVTYSPTRNRYASQWYNESKIDQRFDYVLYRSTASFKVDVSSCSIVFDAPDRLLSDHFGLVSDLTLSPLPS